MKANHDTASLTVSNWWHLCSLLYPIYPSKTSLNHVSKVIPRLTKWRKSYLCYQWGHWLYILDDILSRPDKLNLYFFRWFLHSLLELEQKNLSGGLAPYSYFRWVILVKVSIHCPTKWWRLRDEEGCFHSASWAGWNGPKRTPQQAPYLLSKISTPSLPVHHASLPTVSIM